jgi:hypothetical protein
MRKKKNRLPGLTTMGHDVAMDYESLLLAKS